MNILQIISRHHNRSGSGVQMMQLSLELAKRGHKVTTVYRYNPANNEDFIPYKNSNITLLRLPFNKTRLRLTSLGDIFMVRKLLKEGDFDLVHTHSNVVDHVFLASLGMDIPIFSNRGMSAKLTWLKGIKYRSKKIRQVIAVSKDIKQIMMETARVPEEKIEVVYGSVDVTRFNPELRHKTKKPDNPENNSLVTRKQINIPEDAFVFGYTGSIGGRKGIGYLLQAFETVLQQYSENNPYLLLVGINQEQLYAQGFALKQASLDRIVCAGFQHRPEFHMALFDTFVFPGIRDEGLTGAIREAASMKIPVISTDNGGNRELVIHQKSGLMVPTKDDWALSNAMKIMIKDKQKREKLAEKAYQMVTQSMTIQKRTDAIESIYTKFLTYTDSIVSNKYS